MSYNERQKCRDTQHFLSTLDKFSLSPLSYNPLPQKQCWIYYLQDLPRLCTTLKIRGGEWFTSCN